MRILIILMLIISLLRCDTNPSADHGLMPDEAEFFQAESNINPQKESSMIKAERKAVAVSDQEVRTNPLPRLQTMSATLNKNQIDELSQPVRTSLPSSVAEKLQPTTVFLEFENDIFTGKDYYYTNGVTIGFSAPWLSFLKKTGLFPILGAEAQERFGISLTQKMFTGLNPEAEEPTSGDHPFAGLLYAEFSGTSSLAEKGLFMRSGITLGVTGPASLASYMQKLMHELEPSGWNFQTGNSLLINYSISIENEVVRNKTFRLGSGVAIKAGNLETLSSAYLRLTFDLLPEATTGYGLQVFATAQGSFVLHKASLRGGLWGAGSPYLISFEELRKTVGELGAGLMFQVGRSAIGLKMVSLSPEFVQGRPHSWGSIQVNYNL